MKKSVVSGALVVAMLSTGLSAAAAENNIPPKMTKEEKLKACIEARSGEVSQDPEIDEERAAKEEIALQNNESVQEVMSMWYI